MDYLQEVLGITVSYGEELEGVFPNYISSRYKIGYVYLDDIKTVFVYPHQPLDDIKMIKKHFGLIKEKTACSPVLILDHLGSREKSYLIKERIPFVVVNKQIYLPFMAVYLREKGEGGGINKITLLPSSQLLLLYYIYHGCGALMTSVAVKDLGFTPMSISRHQGN